MRMTEQLIDDLNNALDGFDLALNGTELGGFVETQKQLWELQRRLHRLAASIREHAFGIPS